MPFPPPRRGRVRRGVHLRGDPEGEVDRLRLGVDPFAEPRRRDGEVKPRFVVRPRVVLGDLALARDDDAVIRAQRSECLGVFAVVDLEPDAPPPAARGLELARHGARELRSLGERFFPRLANALARLFHQHRLEGLDVVVAVFELVGDHAELLARRAAPQQRTERGAFEPLAGAVLAPLGGVAFPGALRRRRAAAAADEAAGALDTLSFRRGSLRLLLAEHRDRPPPRGIVARRCHVVVDLMCHVSWSSVFCLLLVLLCRAIDRGEDSFEDSAETKGFNE